jgi:shikimate kinase
MKNIALIGFMGAGKSTVASLLAKELDEELIETDAEILRLAGLSSINEIFDTKGEGYFRKLEKQVIKDSVKNGSSIISCGGGVVSDVESMEILKANAIVIFLNTSFNVIKERLKHTDIRPLFRQEEKAMLLYAERSPLYRRFADEIIDTDAHSPEEIVQMIIDKYSFTYGH